jgi:hypothetical protein
MQTEFNKAIGNKRILFFKSQISAYTTKHGVFVPAHTDKRTKRSLQSGKDDHTLDMFAPNVPSTPKRDIPVAALEKPEDFTPDLFDGKTKADERTIKDDVEELRTSLNYGDLSGAIDQLTYMDYGRAWEVLGRAGFSLGFLKRNTTRNLIASVQDQLVQAVKPKEILKQEAKPATRKVRTPGEGTHTEVIMPDGSKKRTKQVEAHDLHAQAKHIADIPEDTRDDMQIGDFAGGAEAYNLFEAKKMLSKPGDKLKRVTSDNSFSLWQDYEFIANVDGVHFGITKQEDPDEPDDEKKFVYAFQRLDQHHAQLVTTTTDDKAELISEMRKKAGSMLAKSDTPRILFLKSHVKQFTRADGTVVKEHDDKRTKKMEVAPVARAPAQQDAPASKPAAQAPEASQYGHHNVEEGDSLKFKAGDFAGGGKVKSVGQDGATVTDSSGRDHNVHWNEVTEGYWRREGASPIHTVWQHKQIHLLVNMLVNTKCTVSKTR